MTGWTPDPQSVAVFSIGRLTPSFANDRAVRELHERFSLVRGAFNYNKLTLRDARWPELLAALTEGTAAEVLGIRGDKGVCWIEEPSPPASDKAAWFDLQTGSAEFKSAARAPAAEHLLWSDQQYFASQVFIDAVTSRKLTGLDWLPVESARSTDPMRWYQVFATHPLGRGLDHPLMDTAAKTARDSKDRDWDLSRRHGDPTAWIKDGFRLEIADPLLLALSELAGPKQFRIQGPERYVHEHLPPVDFGYRHWSSRIDGPLTSSGRGIRGIACNHRARTALMEAGVMKPRRFTTLAVVPAAEANNVILDDIIEGALPLPTFTTDEAAIERTRREAVIRVARPEVRLTFRSIDEAESYLLHRIESGSASWNPARTHAGFERVLQCELFARTPVAWQRLSPLLPLLLNTDDSEFEFEMIAPEWNDWLDSDDSREAEEAPSESDMVIAISPNGDWFAFRDDDAALPGDARIAYWDHETTSIKDEWPSVLAFAAHIVGLCDRASDGE